MSSDHKPYHAKEEARIKKAGHYVQDNRVDATLAVSRALGNFKYKDQKDKPPEEQAITCIPDVVKRKRSPDDKFIVIACDGIWDCLSNEECVNKLSKKIKNIKSLEDKSVLKKPIESLFDSILSPNIIYGTGTDNMTALVIYFHD